MTTRLDAFRREMMAAGHRLLDALSLEHQLSLMMSDDPANETLAAKWRASRKGVDDLAVGYTRSISRYRESMAAALNQLDRKK